MKKSNSLTLSTDNLKSRIYTIRGMQVMLDRDLAELYDVETGTLNQAVKRNAIRFPETFMFQLTPKEYECLISQIVISKTGRGGIRKLPYAFTEQGVAMLSGVLIVSGFNSPQLAVKYKPSSEKEYCACELFHSF